jgi:predicted Fe-Mo cluster-binding NifX family protein
MLSEEMGDEGQVHWQTATSVSVVETDRGEVDVEAVEEDEVEAEEVGEGRREVSRTRSSVLMAVVSTRSAVAILAKTGIVLSCNVVFCFCKKRRVLVEFECWQVEKGWW